MDKKNAKQVEFITLRADGISFDKIANQLNISKPTAIQWSKLFEEDIKELQFITYLEIKEAYSWSKKKKYENLLKQIDKIDEAILNADLSTTSLKELVTVKNDILYSIEKIERSISVDANINYTDEFGIQSKLRLQLNEAE